MRGKRRRLPLRPARQRPARPPRRRSRRRHAHPPRAAEQRPSLCGFTEPRCRAKAWKPERRVCARIEATIRGLDIRYVVTSLAASSPEHVYETLYCVRGQAESLIKLQKTLLASDSTSCRSPLANQVRPALYTAAHRLMPRCAMPSPRRIRWPAPALRGRNRPADSLPENPTPISNPDQPNQEHPEPARASITRIHTPNTRSLSRRRD